MISWRMKLKCQTVTQVQVPIMLKLIWTLGKKIKRQTKNKKQKRIQQERVLHKELENSQIPV
jgi:hypothetical protein